MTAPGAEPRVVKVQKAKSEKTNWLKRTIYKSKNREVTVVVNLIPHNSGRTGVVIKILRGMWSAAEDGSKKWVEDELSLDEASTENLLEAMQSAFEVGGRQGRFLVVPVDGSSPDIATLEKDEVAKAIQSLLASPGAIDFFAEGAVDVELTKALQATFRLKDIRRAVQELEELLKDRSRPEQDFQNWCNRHPWAFGNGYVGADAVRRISNIQNVDILLPTVLSGFRDVVELKKADAPVVLQDPSRKHYHFGPEVNKAIGQITYYLEALHDNAKNGLLGNEQVVAYYPSGIIVIGSSQAWSTAEHKALARLNGRLSGIVVMTYDHLLERARRVVRLLDSPEEAAQ